MTKPLQWLQTIVTRLRALRLRRTRPMRVTAKIPDDHRLWSQKHVDLTGSRYR